MDPEHLLAPGRLAELLEDAARLPADATHAAWSSSLAAGVFVGGYEIVRVAGRGGLADVHQARERATGRLVALKLFRPGPRLRTLVSTEALRAEADVAVRIQHPSVVGCFDAGTWAGGPYVVSEWQEGTSLSERLRERPLPAAEVLRFSKGIAAALEAAHSAGVVHRDLEPGNVLLLPDGGVKVTGFGLARPSGKALSAGGAPPFMAPEQWRGESGDARTDVFALGVIMFQALTGNIPYAVGGHHTEALERGRTPRTVGEGIPRRLAEVVTRCLHRDPARRFRDGSELVRALAAAERGEPLAGFGRRRVFAAAAAAAAIVVAAGSWFLLRGQGSGAMVPVVVLDEVDGSKVGAFAGVSDLLARALEPSNRIRVVPRGDLREAAKAAGSGRLDLAAVKPAWDTIDARWALELRLRPLAGGWVAELSAVSPRTGDRAFTVAERCGDLSTAVDMVDRLARRARLELGEPLPEVEENRARLGSTYTPDLEAWRWYRDGEDCLAAPRAPERPCAGPYRQAVAKDPGFGAAHLALARLAVEANAGPDEQRAMLEPVLARGSRLPPRAREVALAWRAALDGDGDALGAYRKLADAAPADTLVTLLGAEAAWQRGQLPDAVEWLDRALRAAPDDPVALARLARVLGHLGDRGRLEALAGRLEAGARSSASLHVLSLARGWLGDARAASAAAEVARKAGSPLAAEDAVHALAAAGDLVRAEAHAREDLASAPPARRAARRVLLAEALGQQGRWKEAQRELDLALQEGGPDQEVALRAERIDLLAGVRDETLMRREIAALEAVAPGRAPAFATTLAYLGDLAGASPLAMRLPPSATAARIHAAVAAWRGGDAKGGASTLRGLVGDRRADGGIPVEAGPFLLGSALADAGDHAAAVDVLRGFQGLYEHGGWRPWAHPRSRLLLSGSLVAIGRRAEASEELGKLLGSLQKADPDDPLLRAARILQVQVEGRPIR